MPSRIDELRLRLSVRSPKHEHQVRSPFADYLDDAISELLPPRLGMRSRQAPLHRERGVEHQHTLFCPALQVAMLRNVQIQVALEFLEDVLQ